MTHTRWLCGVVRQRGRGGIEGLLQLFLRRICFGWPTEDVSVDFSLPVGFFFVLVPPEESFFFAAPEWESINGIWRVGGGVGGYRRSAAVHCELSRGKTGVGFFVPPPHLSLCWVSVGRVAFSSSQSPLLSSSAHLSGILLLSFFLSVLLLFFPSSLCQSQYLTRLLLSLIQFPHLFFAPLPLHLHMWCEMNCSFLFVFNLWPWGLFVWIENSVMKSRRHLFHLVKEQLPAVIMLVYFGEIWSL